MLRAQVWTWKMLGECGEGRVKANFRWTNSLLNWTSGMSCDCRWWCSWLSTCCQWCWCRGCHAFFRLKAQQLSIVNCVNCFNCFNFKIWGCIQDTAQTRLQKCPNRSLLLQVRQYNYSKVRYAAPAHSDTFCTLDVWSPVLRGAIVAGAISTASWAVPQESAASVLFAIWKRLGMLGSVRLQLVLLCHRSKHSISLMLTWGPLLAAYGVPRSIRWVSVSWFLWWDSRWWTAVYSFLVWCVLPRKQLQKNPPRSPLNYILASVKKSLEEHLG